MYALLLAVIYLAFVSLGLPDSLLGAAWPSMYPQLGVPVGAMGVITMVISGCTVVSSLLSNRLIRAFGTRGVVIGSVFLTAVALLGFSLADTFWLLVLLAVPYGLGAGCIDAALNNYAAIHLSARHMSWLHCFWGVGTIVGPFAMGWALTHGGWHLGYRIVAALQLAIGVFLVLTRHVWKSETAGRTEDEKNTAGLMSAARVPGVPAAILGFLGYCALEVTAASWASTYFVTVAGIAESQAADFASLFYIGITAGRFLAGIVATGQGDRKMIRIGLTVVGVGLVLLAVSSVLTGLAAVAFVIVGLGCAPVYPSIMHHTPEAFGARNSASVIGLMMALGYVGTTFVPPLFGLLGQTVGFWVMPWFLGAFAALTAVALHRADATPR
ncbi:MFS transporter [Kribbibacterium absianum]|uniref:MFS transporter n=1 Tax=Kribbibacterium absianum TaxID=3044210 RepID=UPI0024BC15AB|nr:MFS transporter [Olsenella sp. YH-ols2216]MDJ1122546.1 MFS transporter [Olsenella sp. YH-ols2216]